MAKSYKYISEQSESLKQRASSLVNSLPSPVMSELSSLTSSVWQYFYCNRQDYYLKEEYLDWLMRQCYQKKYARPISWFLSKREIPYNIKGSKETVHRKLNKSFGELVQFVKELDAEV
jgi:hypothetical protein